MTRPLAAQSSEARQRHSLRMLESMEGLQYSEGQCIPAVKVFNIFQVEADRPGPVQLTG